MRKYWTLLIMAAAFSSTGNAQTFVTKNGTISFFSQTSLEKIEAFNRQVNAALLVQTGDFVFKVLVKSFTFEKAMMQEHFNEDYLESDKYPEATFLGKVTNIKEINFTQDGSYPATVEGKLTIHGQTHVIRQNGTFEVSAHKVTAKARFTILLADYKISIPNTLVNNISKSIEITVEVMLSEVNK